MTKPLQGSKLALLSARVAVQFMRERPSAPADQISADALAIATAATQSRRDGTYSETTAAHLRALLERYDGALVAPLDRKGVWLGFRLSSPNGPRLVFDLA
jgi:hypothetical protein